LFVTRRERTQQCPYAGKAEEQKSARKRRTARKANKLRVCPQGSSLCCCRRAHPPPPPRQLPSLPNLNTQPILAEGMRKQVLSSMPTSQTALSFSSKSMRSCKPSHRAGQRIWMGVKPYPPQPRQQPDTSWLIWHGPPVENTSSASSKSNRTSIRGSSSHTSSSLREFVQPARPSPKIRRETSAWRSTASQSGKSRPFKCRM